MLYSDVVQTESFRMLNIIGTCIENNLPGVKDAGSKIFSPFMDCVFHFIRREQKTFIRLSLSLFLEEIYIVLVLLSRKKTTMIGKVNSFI